MYAGTRPPAVPFRQIDRDMHVYMYKHEYLQVYGRPPFHNLKNTIQKMQAITNREHKIEFPATGPAGNVERDLIDVMRRTLERDPAKRPTIPELKRHPWLVPPKFGLDSYNILVMVSKVCRCRIYVHVYVYACVYLYIEREIYTHTYIYIQTHIYTYIHTHTHAHTHTHTHVYRYGHSTARTQKGPTRISRNTSSPS